MQSPSSAEDEILFVFGGWPLNPDRSLASGEKWSNITTTCFRFTTFSSSRCMSSRCRDWFLSEEMAVSIKRRIWTPNRRELKLWEVVLVLTVVARFGGKINKSTHRGRDWGLTRHSCKIHHRIQEKHVKPSLWKDQVERHQLAGSVCQLVSVRTIGGNEDKTIGTIPLTYRSSSSASLKLGNFTFGKLSHILLHQSSSFSKVENARAKQLNTNSKHFDPDEFSACCCEKPSTRSPLISPLIRFSRHSTSRNSLSFCPDPQRLGEETSRFFGDQRFRFSI